MTNRKSGIKNTTDSKGSRRGTGNNPQLSGVDHPQIDSAAQKRAKRSRNIKSKADRPNDGQSLDTAAPEVKRHVGRPTDYNADIAALICAELAEGNKSLRTICRADDRPALSTVFNWLRQHKEFMEQYRVAKEAGIEAMMEDTIDIADDGRNDWMETEHGMKVDREAIERSKLRVHTRQWFASRLLPKKYGDKVEQTLKGDETAPLTTRVVLVPAKNAAEVTTRPIQRDGEGG